MFSLITKICLVGPFHTLFSSCTILLCWIFNTPAPFSGLHMAVEDRAESNSTSRRSLHWAPLRSWNLFTGRVRSRLPDESHSSQLSRSRSAWNSSDRGRVNSATNRGPGRFLSSESSRKGGDSTHRDRNQRIREGSHRQGRTYVINEHWPRHSNDSTSMRRVLQDRTVEASDGWSAMSQRARHSVHLVHYQQHHHHDHHHHHFHYHHLHHRLLPRISNEHQDQGSRMPSAVGTPSSSHSHRRTTHQRQTLPNHWPSLMIDSHVATNSHNAAIEARDRLDERLRGLRSAALLSHRHMHGNTGLLGGFLDDFSDFFDDDDDAWSDDEMWEPGSQDWLAAWGYGDGQQADVLPSAEHFPVTAGLSKSIIRGLPKELFVPQLRRKNKESEDTLSEQGDCSVCLEHFLVGQVLIRLPCKHRFHPDCLTPWLESCGQCPYCRAKVCNDEASSP